MTARLGDRDGARPNSGRDRRSKSKPAEASGIARCRSPAAVATVVVGAPPVRVPECMPRPDGAQHVSDADGLRSPRYWLDRADEAVTRAAEMRDADAETTMLEIARMYERMADFAVKREARRI